MGKSSIEGYEGGNWPSTTGNPSGGGRGNAEPTCFEDEQWDDSDDSGSISIIQDAIERHRAWEAQRRQPPRVPLNAKSFTGRLTSFRPGFGGDMPEFEIDERPGVRFRFNYYYTDHLKATNNLALRFLSLIGDHVEFISLRGQVYRFTNHSLDPSRLKAEGNVLPELRRHMVENSVRAGYLGSISEPERSRLLETVPYKVRWQVQSGDFVIPGLGFRTLQQAKEYIEWLSKSGQLAHCSGSAFQFHNGVGGMLPSTQLFTCQIVSQEGHPPTRWPGHR